MRKCAGFSKLSLFTCGIRALFARCIQKKKDKRKSQSVFPNMNREILYNLISIILWLVLRCLIWVYTIWLNTKGIYFSSRSRTSHEELVILLLFHTNSWRKTPWNSGNHFGNASSDLRRWFTSHLRWNFWSSRKFPPRFMVEELYSCTLCRVQDRAPNIITKLI